jgi:hypothetical protein
LVLEIFEEIGLVLGGMVALHDVGDDFVWRLVRSLEATRRKFLGRLQSLGPLGRDPDGREGGLCEKAHPAIEEFLSKVRKEMEEAA